MREFTQVVQPKPRLNSPPTLGLLIDWIERRYHTEIRAGIEAAASKLGANLVYFVGGALKAPQYFEAQRNVIYDLPCVENIDGLIIMSSSISSHVSALEFKQFCDRYRPLPMVSIALTLENIPSVMVDTNTGLRELLVHLIEVHGYQRIAFICGRAGNAEAERRYGVYREVLADYGLRLDPRLIVAGNFERATSYSAIRQLLSQAETAFEAVVAANDEMAIGALEALQMQGWQVPDQIAVAGFDDIKDAQLTTPSLTTVRQPLYEQGQRAAEMLLALLRGESVPQQVVLPSELRVRHSCGCFAQASWRAALPDAPLNFTSQRALALAEITHITHQPERSAQLLDALLTALNDQTPHAFLKTWDGILRLTLSEGGELAIWQRALSTLNEHILPSLSDRDAVMRAGYLWQQALELFTETKQSQVYWGLQLERQTPLLLHEVGRVLITTFDVEQLMETISQRLAPLRLGRCYLAMYEGEAAPTAWARLILACDEGGRQTLEANSQRFPSRDLLPSALWPESPYTLIVEALFFGEEQFGFAVFVNGSQEGIVYQTLAIQISNALKGALLVQQVQSHAATLETEVAIRTLELTQANEQLQREIAERKRADKKLTTQARKLTEAKNRLAEIRETEQLRLAQNLHDGAVQQLIGISYGVEEIRQRISQPQALDAQLANTLMSALQQTRQQVLDVSRQLRSLISELRPAGLKELGLLQALQGYIAHLERGGHAETPAIKLSLPVALPPMPEVAAICLFRVAQEALRNALQHAQAQHIELSLRCHAAEAILRIHDDGVGFQMPTHLSELTGNDHFGLAGMVERVTWSNGQLRIESQPGSGTQITATLPLTKLK